ncbi:MAG: damage-inducible protein DinB [Phycisphaerae bacterium]|nr:damage-inducible protein DinB [Gemmatimonadaceae bacterium]
MSASDTTPAVPLKEFDLEMATTRKMLERLPEGQDHFKPHEKSMEFGYLAELVSAIPGWIHDTLRMNEIDMAAGERHAPRTPREVLQFFDEKVKDARGALEEITGAKLEENWSLKMGDKVLMTMPRGEAARQHLNHLIHHRGQLSVYERLLDVKLPQIYGPSADAPW